MFTKLHILTRILMSVLALSLGAVYFFPLWRIDLLAPQYPEGLGLWIWINRMSGDLDTINGLNHYIGMQEIHPESFAELRLMPWVLGGLILSGLLVVLFNRRLWLGLWLGLMGLCGAVGFWDFWRWTYDYGHNLNPYAAIKVPGMSYQPPILGSKQLLNFTAISWPAVGGWILIAAGTGAALLCLWELLRKVPPHTAPLSGHKAMAKKTAELTGLSTVLLLMVVACAPRPRPLEFGQDQCQFCRMSLMEQDYGAEWVTPQAKVLAFDSVECLVHYQEQNPQKQAHSLWVQDASSKTLVEATRAYYLYSSQVPSPMGAYLTALASTEQAQTLQSKFGGKVLTWNEMLEHLQQSDQVGAQHQHHGGH